MLFFLIMIGSAIFVSAFVVHMRKRAFEVKFKSIVEQKLHERRRSRGTSIDVFSSGNPPPPSRSREQGLDDNDIELQNAPIKSSSEQDSAEPSARGRKGSSTWPASSASAFECALEVQDDDRDQEDRVTFSRDTRFTSPKSRHSHRRRSSNLFSAQGVGARPGAGLYPTTSRNPASIAGLDDKGVADRHLSSGFVSRNSQFYGLTEADRVKLGGVEYKAICFLAWIVPLYYVLFQLLGCLGLAAYVAVNRPDTARANGLNPWWVGAFNGVSAFNNSGMSPLDANMTAFQTSYYMLLTMGFMILAGNTCYPIFLRLSIWSILKLMPKSESWNERRSTLRFLLDHPRRCYTNLFPSKHTWWLVSAVFVLNGTDWAAFEILNASLTSA